MKKKGILTTWIIATVLLTACHEKLEDRAVREAKEYTEKYCPTPVENHTRTDSVVFERESHTYHYYCTLTDMFDDAQVIHENRQRLHDGILQGIIENTSLQIFKDAGYRFAYTCHSAKNPSMILYEESFGAEHYQRFSSGASSPKLHQ